MHDLEAAWDEGWTSSEILEALHDGDDGPVPGRVVLAAPRGVHATREGRRCRRRRGRTTARPPVRAPRLGGPDRRRARTVERRTALHDRHVAGRRADRPLRRRGSAPGTYGDVAEEIRAVRERVSVMDVSTLGKFLVAGRDARALLDCVFPLDVGAVAPGRARYLLALDEAGYVMDDGLARRAPRRVLLPDLDVGRRRPDGGVAPQLDRPARPARAPRRTRPRSSARSTSRGRTRATCSPRCPTTTSRARRSPTRDTPRSPSPASPAGRSRSASSASSPTSCTTRAAGASSCGMRCSTRGRALGHPPARPRRPRRAPAREGARLPRAGHDARRSPREARARVGGRDGQAAFVGKRALERMDALPLERRLVGLRFDGPPQRGHPLAVDGAIVGRDHLVRGVGGGRRPRSGSAGSGRSTASSPRRCVPATSPRPSSPTPFYDPEGVRLRA